MTSNKAQCPFSRADPFRPTSINTCIAKIQHTLDTLETENIKSFQQNSASTSLLQSNTYFTDVAYPNCLKSLLYTEQLYKPTLLVWKHFLYLVFEEKQEVALITPPIYTNLKMMCHIPLSIFLIILPSVFQFKNSNPSLKIDISPSVLDQLNHYHKIVLDIENTLAQLFSEKILTYQRQLLKLCFDFISSVQSSGSISYNELKQLTKSSAVYTEKNLEHAVKSILNATHLQMLKWKDQLLSNNEWDSLRVVIGGNSMARYKQMHKQYFAKLLKAPMESKRIIYAENARDIEDMFKIVGTLTTDLVIGDAFFEDPGHMQSDIQGVWTTRYLPKLFTKDIDELEKLVCVCEKK